MFSIRYDYENCESSPAEQMMTNLRQLIQDPAYSGKAFSQGDKSFTVAKIDDFEYTDPIDKSVAKKQVRYACIFKFIKPFMFKADEKGLTIFWKYLPN